MRDIFVILLLVQKFFLIPLLFSNTIHYIHHSIMESFRYNGMNSPINHLSMVMRILCLNTKFYFWWRITLFGDLDQCRVCQFALVLECFPI